MAMAQHAVPHVSSDELRRFAAGALSEEQSTVIEDHLASCETCCGLLAELPPHDIEHAVRQAQRLPDYAPAPPSLEVELLAQPEQCGGDSVLTEPAALWRPDTPGQIPAELVRHPRYRIVRLVGQGGMGAVYEAEHLIMKRRVALKVIHPRLLNRPIAIERFRREVEAASRLSHPNIVTAHDADHAGDMHFLAMEFVEGHTLADIVADRGALPVHVACDYVRQAAVGLQHAFELGMVHRDIKPHNLIVAGSAVKILDFGLARFASEQSPAAALTSHDSMLGTPDFIAPEQARDAHAADIRADIYALGCTLYFALTGDVPFPAGSFAEKLVAHLERTPEPLTLCRPDVPAALSQLVQRMMAKDPRQRPATPAIVAAALEPFIRCDADMSAGVPSSHIGSEPHRAGRQPNWRRRWAAVAAAAVALAAILAQSGQIIRIATNRGQIVIETDDPETEVLVRRDGAVIHDRTTQRKFELHAGDYELRIYDSAHQLEFRAREFTVRRGDRRTVSARLETTGDARAGLPLWNPVLAAPSTAPGRPTLLASSGYDAKVRFWDIDTGEERHAVDAHTAAVERVAFTRDLKTMITTSHDRSSKIWDAGPVRQRLVLEHPGSVEPLDVSPDGRLLVTGCDDAALRIFEIATGSELQTLRGHTARLGAVAFSPDGTRVASGGEDNTIKIFDVGTGRLIRSLDARGGYIGDVRFAPDGRWLATAHHDGTIRVWNSSGEIHTILKEHGAGVERLAFSPDSRMLLSGSHDATAILWNIPDGTVQHKLEGHGGGVWGVTFSQDGSLAATGCMDGAVRIWDVATAELVRKLPGHRDQAGHPRWVNCVTFVPPRPAP